MEFLDDSCNNFILSITTESDGQSNITMPNFSSSAAEVWILIFAFAFQAFTIQAFGNSSSICDVNDQDACRDKTNNQLCSNRGDCICGECNCLPRSDPAEVISGQYCECDNFSCARSNGQVCSGASHGKCVCGICQCEPHWEGEACDCPYGEDICINPDNPTFFCMRHGTCNCGQCICDEGYQGKYCEVKGFQTATAVSSSSSTSSAVTVTCMDPKGAAVIILGNVILILKFTLNN